MAQDNEHIRKLIAARDREVEQRRNVADALAQAYERGETERMREVFINLQNTIEAIERAIQHEKGLSHPEGQFEEAEVEEGGPLYSASEK
jgi:hypothetical protein